MQISCRPVVNSDKSLAAGTESISVVIPVFNGAAYLEATLRSVTEQSSPPGEVIVVDDGSTDDTVAIARSFDVTLISQNNRGLSAARNTGTYAAKGEWIAYLDGDDLWAPEKLEHQFRALCSLGQPAFSFTEYRTFSENGIDERRGVRRHPAFKKAVGKLPSCGDVIIKAGSMRPVLPDDYILPSSTLIRRSDFIAVGGFDESLRISEDHEFFLRLFRIVPAIAVMQPLVLYRRHAAQISAKPIALVAAFFDIQRCIAAAPERYPAGDVKYFAGAAFLAYRRIGVLQARLGRFPEARQAFARSLAVRPTIFASFGLAASWLASTAGGRLLFLVARAVLRGIRARESRRTASAAANVSGKQ